MSFARGSRLLRKIIPSIEKILAAGEIEPPKNEGVVEPAIPNKESIGDAGHRNFPSLRFKPPALGGQL